MPKNDKGPGLKQEDLRPCGLCGKGLMNSGIPLCYRITIDRLGFDANAIREQAGLEMMLGNAAIAHVMGTHADMAKPITDQYTALICEKCGSHKQVCMGELMERISPDEDEAEEA